MKPTTLKRTAVAVAATAALVLVWHLGAGASRSSLLPLPLPVARDVLQIFLSGEFFFHAGRSLFRIGIGFLLALGASVTVGILMGRHWLAESFFLPYILIGLSIPSLAWAVMAVIWFGTSDLGPIFTVFVITAPILVSNIWEGTKAVDGSLLEMAKAYDVSGTLLLVQVVLPQLVPFLISGARYGFSIAWKVVVIAEMLGLSNGVGFKINYAFSMFSMKDVLAWTIAFTVIMAGIEWALRVVELRVSRWRPVPAR